MGVQCGCLLTMFTILASNWNLNLSQTKPLLLTEILTFPLCVRTHTHTHTTLKCWRGSEMEDHPLASQSFKWVWVLFSGGWKKRDGKCCVKHLLMNNSWAQHSLCMHSLSALSLSLSPSHSFLLSSCLHSGHSRSEILLQNTVYTMLHWKHFHEFSYKYDSCYW